MRLSNGTIRPGIVLEVLENGAIKASAPGLFSFTDDPNMMPIIMPWFIGNNTNAFSQPIQYEEVWIMNFSDNPRQLYWFRKDKLSDNTNIPMQEENVEIVCNREVAGEWATIYFSDGSGWIIGKGKSIIQIKPDGSILMSTGMPNRNIHINGEGISLGSENKSNSPAAKGDAVVDALNALGVILNQVAQVALPNPYTAPIGTTLMGSLPSFISKIPNIPSQHVSID